MQISEFQKLMKKIYYKRDKKRGVSRTFVWFIEEVGEFAKAIREGKEQRWRQEASDVFAWLLSLTNLLEIDIEEEVKKYEKGCPKCGEIPCRCVYDEESFKIS